MAPSSQSGEGVSALLVTVGEPSAVVLAGDVGARVSSVRWAAPTPHFPDHDQPAVRPISDTSLMAVKLRAARPRPGGETAVMRSRTT